MILGKVIFKIEAHTRGIKYTINEIKKEPKYISILLLYPMLKWYLKSKYAFPKSYGVSLGIIVKFQICQYKFSASIMIRT